MLIVHLFVIYAYVNLCHFFSSSWCRGLAAASACGSSWTFLFTFFSIQIVLSNISLYFRIYMYVYICFFSDVLASAMILGRNIC